MVSRNLRHGHLLEVGLTQILVNYAPLSTTCHVELHVDLSSTNFMSLGLHLLVWSELGRSPPFRPMRARTLPRSGAFSLVGEVNEWSSLWVLYDLYISLPCLGIHGWLKGLAERKCKAPLPPKSQLTQSQVAWQNTIFIRLKESYIRPTHINTHT